MRKLVFIKNGIETLGYFSVQLEIAFREMGYETFLFDLLEPEQSMVSLIWYCARNQTTLVTFNYTGIGGEDIFQVESGKSIWDERNVQCINIVVDHPFYYDDFMKNLPQNYVHVSIDRDHDAYIRHFYPEVVTGGYLPLAGTDVYRDSPALKKDYASRPYNLVFTGNYTPPQEFERHICRLGEEYEGFYRGIIDDLIGRPSQTMESVMLRHVEREMGSLSLQEMRAALKNLIFIDLYVRFHFRGKIVKELADARLGLVIAGKGWERLPCRYPDMIRSQGLVDSSQCLVLQQNARISLNVMPWFKNGAHDRVFNAMLSGAVCLTDTSRYLSEELKDGEQAVFYCLEHLEETPEKADWLLHHPEKAAQIARQGYEYARQNHTWKNRAESLLRLFEE